MSLNHCDHVIDYFNGELEGDLLYEFQKHIEGCQACQEELAELNSLMEVLPYASEPVSPPIGMKERVLTNVFHEEKEKVIPIEVPVGNNKKWITWVLAASLFISLIGNIYSIMSKDNVATIEDNGELGSVYKSMALTPSEELANAVANASMIKNEKGMTVVIQASNLKPLQGNEAYQVWLIEGENKYRAGTFVPNESGEGAVVYPIIHEEKLDYDVIAITVEPTPTSQQPQGNIVFSAEL